ncbi:MAG: hypothetical protein V2A74_00975, partial [bacterium]
MLLMSFCTCLHAGETLSKTDTTVPIYQVDPWTLLRGEEKIQGAQLEANKITLQGFRNEFVVGAVIIKSAGKADLTVAFEGEKDLCSAVSLSPVGEVQSRDSQGNLIWVPDVLLDNLEDLPDSAASIRNWDSIRDFPALHLLPSKPVVLWLSIDTFSLAAGKWNGKLQLTEDGNVVGSAAVEIVIYPIELPKDNPIIGYTWTTYKEDEPLARRMRTYGINACGYYDNWEMLRKNGYRFFKFNFPLSNWEAKSLDASDDSIEENLQPIRETVQKLGLKSEEWAIEIFDEPFDKNAWAYMAWVLRIRRLW